MLVGVSVAVSVGVYVEVSVGVSVEVSVGVNVGVDVEVDVTVGVTVSVTVGVGVLVGAEDTFSVALAVLPSVVFAEVTGPLTLLYVPALEEVTTTVTVQVPPAASAPLERPIPPPPGSAISIPPQVLVVVSGVAFTRPVG